MLELADVIDSEPLAHQVGVFRRGESLPRYQNTLNAEGAWTSEPALRAAIERERERPWTAQETADFLDTQRRLRAELSERWAPRLDQIETQAQPYLAHRQAQTHFPAPSRTRQIEPELEAGM